MSLSVRNLPVTGGFPHKGSVIHDDVIKWKHFPRYWLFVTQRPVTRSFDVFFDVRPNKQLSKQSWGWWFETLSPSLWRHRNVIRKDCTCHGVVVWCSHLCRNEGWSRGSPKTASRTSGLVGTRRSIAPSGGEGSRWGSKGMPVCIWRSGMGMWPNPIGGSFEGFGFGLRGPRSCCTAAR